MNWGNVELLKEVEVAKDALQNPIYELQAVGTSQGRYTPWSNEEKSLEGREITMNTQKVLLRMMFQQFQTKAPTHILLQGKAQKITQVENLFPRFTLLRVEVRKE